MFSQARINAIYRQATRGDCNDDMGCSSPLEKNVLKTWRKYKGTSQLIAKRRFLSLLRDVDVGLLEVKAYQGAPWGFPTTSKGEPICPYSNSRNGCPRPLMDKYGHNLHHELETNKNLADFVQLKKWLEEVTPQQRCSLGLHVPITSHAGSRFKTFFARPECGGFQPYAPTGLHEMVKKVRCAGSDLSDERVHDLT